MERPKLSELMDRQFETIGAGWMYEGDGATSSARGSTTGHCWIDGLSLINKIIQAKQTYENIGRSIRDMEKLLATGGCDITGCPFEEE